MIYSGKEAILCICRNINCLKHAELLIEKQNEELKKLNNEKDKFFSILAHDLKSPFNSVVGLCDLLKLGVEEKDYESIKEYTTMIVQSANKATDLLKNLMEWSKSQTGRLNNNPVEIDMVNLIKDNYNLYYGVAAQKAIIINAELHKSIFMYADKDMINTIIRNLISNAIKFTPPGGLVTIVAEVNDGEVVVKISDTGVGIPKNALENLFHISSKYTTPGTQNEQGTGLGLILCKEFISKHNGKIWAESEVGVGSSFIFTIPLINKL